LDKVFDQRASDLADARQKRPLVGPRHKALVEKDAMTAFARTLLQRQRDEIAESALRQRVLIGKQPVVGVQADIGALLHGLGQEVRAEAPRERRRNRLLEEDPEMPTAT
jgi:hypothetical protein